MLDTFNTNLFYILRFKFIIFFKFSCQRSFESKFKTDPPDWSIRMSIANKSNAVRKCAIVKNKMLNIHIILTQYASAVRFQICTSNYEHVGQVVSLDNQASLDAFLKPVLLL